MSAQAFAANGTAPQLSKDLSLWEEFVGMESATEPGNGVTHDIYYNLCVHIQAPPRLPLEVKYGGGPVLLNRPLRLSVPV